MEAATRPHLAIGGLLLLAPVASAAAQAADPGLAAPVHDTVRLGTAATLAPLCGLRDESWAFDLRRAAMLDATRAARPDDDALRDAPGAARAAAALGYAEAEALEDFAASPPAATCTPLRDSPDLARADAAVRAFRALKATRPAS